MALKQIDYHSFLVKKEAENLERKGYKVFEEYVIARCRVDVIGFRNDGVVIIECGWLSNLDKIKQYTKGVKVISVPSLKCFLPTAPPDKPMHPVEYYLERE